MSTHEGVVERGVLRTTVLECPATPESVLRAAAEKMSDDAVGFAYSPDAVSWFRRDGHSWVYSDSKPVEVSTAFELRVFDGINELRWRHDNDASRGPVVLSEGTVSEPGIEDVRVFDTDGYERLVWGLTTGSHSDDKLWVEVFHPRIGTLWVPVDVRETKLTRGLAVVLCAVEYVREDKHGNISVVDERLCGLRLRSGQ